MVTGTMNSVLGQVDNSISIKCLSGGTDLLKVFCPPHDFPGMRVLAQDFIEPILVRGCQDHTAPTMVSASLIVLLSRTSDTPSLAHPGGRIASAPDFGSRQG
jgi:hypothetical protein